jgi:hypothetical protein
MEELVTGAVVMFLELDGVEVTMIVVEFWEDEDFVEEVVIVGCEVINDETLDARLEELGKVDVLEVLEVLDGWGTASELWLSETTRRGMA